MADEKTRCPKCLAWYNPLEGEHRCSELHLMLVIRSKEN